MQTSLLRALLAACAALALPHCGPPGPASGVPDASRSSFTVDLARVLADGAAEARATATVRDGRGAPAAGVQVTFSLSGAGNQLGQPAPTGKDGLAVGTLTSTRSERKTLTATLEHEGAQVPFGGELALDFVAGPPAGLVFLVQPSTSKAGEPISPAVKLEVQDAKGNRASAPATASVRLLNATGGAVVQGGSSAAAVDGVITFRNLVINRPQAGYTLVAEPAGLPPVESAPFEVTLGELSANTSTLTAAPGTVVADGVATSTLTATLRDSGGNPLPGVELTLAATGSGNLVGALTGASDAAGVFSTTFASTVAEPKTVTLTSGTVVLLTQLTFVP